MYNIFLLLLHKNQITEKMKKILFILLVLCTTVCTVNGANPKKTNVRYLKGAVPMIDGKVVFTLDKDYENCDAQKIYDNVYDILYKMTNEENQFEQSQITLVNKNEHIIVARFKEWMVFQKNAFVYDRAVFNYTVIARCSNNHVNITISHINYIYETDDNGEGGYSMPAEKCISDEFALTKNKKKLSKYYGKFRRMTIERKDEIFNNIHTAITR